MTCDPDIFKFDTTEHLEHITTGIGQDRGIKALEFGVNVDIKGYNLSKDVSLRSALPYYVKKIIDYSNKLDNCLPCGYCRQFMNQYVDDNFKIYCYYENKVDEYTINDLLPHSFRL